MERLCNATGYTLCSHSSFSDIYPPSPFLVLMESKKIRPEKKCLPYWSVKSPTLYIVSSSLPSYMSFNPQLAHAGLHLRKSGLRVRFRIPGIAFISPFFDISLKILHKFSRIASTLGSADTRTPRPVSGFVSSYRISTPISLPCDPSSFWIPPPQKDALGRINEQDLTE